MNSWINRATPGLEERPQTSLHTTFGRSPPAADGEGGGGAWPAGVPGVAQMGCPDGMISHGGSFTLWLCQNSYWTYLNMAHLVRWFTMIYLLKMVIFHSYVSLPEGNHDVPWCAMIDLRWFNMNDSSNIRIWRSTKNI